MDFQTHRKFEFFETGVLLLAYFAIASLAAEGTTKDSRLIGAHPSLLVQFPVGKTTAAAEARSAARACDSFFKL
jgi:hypothetical protein